MLNKIRKWAAGAAIVAVLMMISAVTGCGGDDQGTKTRRVARRTAPEIDRTPPVSSAPKAVPVEETAVKVAEAEKPAPPKTVSYEEAEAAYNDRHYETAVDLFGVYVKNRDENPWGFYMLGLSAWKAGDCGYAEESFGKALALAPNHVKSHLNLSRVLLDTERPAEALVHIDRAIEIDPGLGTAFRLKGRALDQLGARDEAVDAYRKAISLDGGDAWSMNNMALILIGEERFEEALLPLARATQIDSGVAVFWNNLGMALERTGRYRSAEEAYGRAFEADEGHEKAYANLVRVQGVDEQPGAVKIDLAEYAQRFIDEMEDWKLAGSGDETEKVTALTDSLVVGVAAVAAPDTSNALPE